MPTATKAAQSSKISVKRAVEIATAYVGDLFHIHSGMNLMLEEVEESEDGKKWLVTLGYDTASQSPFDFNRRSRTYKTVTVDSTSGKVASVKIRLVN